MTEQKKARVSKGRDVKKRKTYLLQISPGVVFRLRRVDLPTLFLEGIVPTPLLAAVDRLQDVRRKVANDQVAAAFETLSAEDRSGFKELMRRCAVASVVDPKLTHSKRASLADPDLLWVGGVSDVPGEHSSETDEPGDVVTADLLVIWKAVLGETGIIIMSDDDADEFRSSEPELPVTAVRDGDGLRPEAVDVVAEEQATATPKKVTFVAYH